MQMIAAVLVATTTGCSDDYRCGSGEPHRCAADEPSTKSISPRLPESLLDEIKLSDMEQP